MFVVLVVLCGLFMQNLVSRANLSLHHSGSLVVLPCFYLFFMGNVTNFPVMSVPCSFCLNWFATVNQNEHVSHLTGYFQPKCDGSSRSNVYVLLLSNAIIYQVTYRILFARSSRSGTCPEANSTLGHFSYSFFHTLLGLQDQLLDQREISIKFLPFLHHFLLEFLLTILERKRRKGRIILEPFEGDERKIHQRLGTTEHEAPRLGRSQVFANMLESSEMRLMGRIGEASQEANGISNVHATDHIGVN